MILFSSRYRQSVCAAGSWGRTMLPFGSRHGQKGGGGVGLLFQQGDDGGSISFRHTEP